LEGRLAVPTLALFSPGGRWRMRWAPRHPAQEEAATEIDEIIVTGQRDYLYRADQSDALGTSIPLAELPATVNVITEDFLEDTRAYDIEDV
jgi:outer membrane receptor for monomeric catechols